MGVSFRSVVIGAVLIPFTMMWVVLAEAMWYSGQPTTISIFCHVVFILFLLVLLNLLVKRFFPTQALEPPELLVIYTMLSLASAISSHDMLQILIPTMAHLAYFEPIERRYGEFMDEVPSWLVVQDETAVTSAYLGQESIFSPANFVPWLQPLMWWFLFIMALCAVMWGLNLVFRKQWTENEKLAYPVIQLPMLITTETTSILTNKLFWLAFSISGFICLINGLNVLYPLIPAVPIVLVQNLQDFFPDPPWNAMGPTWVSFYPFAIGLCFFMPLDLAFSSWFFYWFWKLQRVMAAHMGMQGMPGFPFIEEQTAGGYYVIGLIAIWISRHHIARMVRLLSGAPVEASTPWERREVRLAAIFLASGSVFLFGFSYQAGMAPTLIVVFFVLYFLISVSITRMRAELGPPSHDLYNIGPHKQIVRFMGAANMNNPDITPRGPQTLALFGLFNFFNRAYRSHPMPHGMEAFRISERLRLDHNRYLMAMGTALVLGTLCGFFALLWVFNRYGAAAQMIAGEGFGREAWDHVHIWFTAPERHQYAPTYALLVGMLTALGLAALRMNLSWWPLHPVGYAVSGSWSMDMLWMCVFIAWLVKALLLKYGGAKAYKPAVPFFVGLMMGDFVVGSFWQLYGIIMETTVYHFWPY